MKKIFRSIFAVVILGSSIASTLAQTSVDPMKLPKLTQWVTDFSSTLSLSQTEELNTIARDYETQTSNQLITVLFPHRQGNELIDIGMKLFTDNAIGQAKKNNGLLLLISTQEKKIRIVVGYGLEGVYPDAIANRIIEENIRPLVNSGDFVGAVKMFYTKSAEVIAGEFVGSPESQQLEKIDYQKIFFPLFIFGLILGSWLKRLKKNKKIGRKPLVLGSISLGGLLLSSFLLSLVFSVSVFVLFILLAIGMGFGFFGWGGFFPMGPFGGFGGGGGGFGGGGFGGGGGFSGGGGAGD